MDTHTHALLNVCRIGGKRFSSLSRPTQYPASQFILELRACFDADVGKDEAGVHPPAICHICRSVVLRYQEAASAGRPFALRGGGCGDQQEWVPHSRLNCLFCTQLDNDRYKGRPKKKRRLWAGGVPVSCVMVEDQASSSGSSVVLTSGYDTPKGPFSNDHVPTSNAVPTSLAASGDDADGQVAVDLHTSDTVERPDYPRKEFHSADADHHYLEVPTTSNCSLNDIPWTEMVGMATPDYRSNEDCLLSPDRLSQPLNDLLCSVCKHIINQGVEAPCCKQLFCAECIWAWLATAEKCPTCRCELCASALTSIHPRIAGILAEIEVTCDYSNTDKLCCVSKVQLQNLKLHVASCPFRPGAAPHSPLRRVVTPSTTVQDILTASPSKLRGDVAQRVASHLVGSQEDDGVLTLRTAAHGGKSQTWVRLTKARTGSNQATDRTLRRRSSEIEQVRDLVSGGPTGSSTQQADELRRLRSEAQEGLLREAGLAPKGTVGCGTGLALKADLHLPWYKLRKLRRWLSSFGVTLESEASMRQRISDELPFELCADLVPLVRKDGSIAAKPVVRFLDLPGLILHYFSQHQIANTISWHGGALPSDEVWVKIGGDHGGGSFKMSFQIVNAIHPNSIRNTIPFLVFAAPDSANNLATLLGPYSPQIQQLQTTTWEGKAVRCIFFGDYELICSCYGFSGASSVRPCLFCLMTRKDMQLEPADQPVCGGRTLESLSSDLQKFQADGSRLPQAKFFNNVIRPALCPIPIDWVCIPALHLDLGIYAWMFDAFIADMRQLDMRLAMQLGKSGTDSFDSAAFAAAAELSTDINNKTLLQEQLATQVTNIQSHVSRMIACSHPCMS